MTIAFNTIPVNLRIPGQFIEYDNSRAVQGTPALPTKVLLIGLRTSSGSVAENVPVQVPSAADGEAFFGHGSQLAQMVEKFKAVNEYTELWAIAMDEESGGTAATGTFVFSGTATEAGNIYTYIGGERIVTAVASGDAAATVGANVVADVTEYLKTSNLPVSVAGTTTVTATCLHKGTVGNGIKLEANRGDGEATPAGLTNTVTTMGGVIAGATDPPLSGPIAVFGDTWYTHIVSALADDTNMDLLETEMDTRWGPMVQRDAHAFIGVVDTLSNTTTAGNARNSKHTTLMGGGESPTPHWIWATVTCAVDANESDPARPRQTLKLTGCVAALPGDRWTASERNTLLTDGVSTHIIGTDGTCYIERLITTYQTNAASLPDPSYLDRCTMGTLAALRYTTKLRIALRFPRHKLASDGATIPPGQPIVTPIVIKGELIALYKDTWMANGWVEAAMLDDFKKSLLVERDSSDVNRLNAIIPPDLMNQFRVFAGQIQFLL